MNSDQTAPTDRGLQEQSDLVLHCLSKMNLLLHLRVKIIVHRSRKGIFLSLKL